MNEFFEKFKSDKLYKIKVKLLLYLGFIVIVSIYAFSLNNGNSNLQENNSENVPEIVSGDVEKPEDIPKTLKISEKYKYTISINIDDKIYQYLGEVVPNKETITKIVDNEKIDYLYQNGQYYQVIDGVNELVAKDVVYDDVNQNYINLNNINSYLEKAILVDNEYRIYLDNVVVGADKNKYFTIIIDNNDISINYLNLVKEFNNNINKYNVNIKLEELE